MNARTTGNPQSDAPARDLQPSAQWLFQHFDTLADTPEAVAKLRRLVLNLAVQGRLVPQDSADEPAKTLIKQIEVERGRRVAAKALEASPRMKVLERPDSLLPEGWVWASFGRITFCRDGERIPVSSAKRATLAKTYDYYGASGIIDKIDRYIFDKPLLLIGEDGANLVNRSTSIAFIADGKYWVNNHAHVLDGIDRTLLDYLCVFINSINLEPYLTGMAQPKMNQAQMNSIPVALPPLAEQKRIVAKVEELLALCDALEARQTAAREHRARLVHSALDHLTQSRSSRRESALTSPRDSDRTGKDLSGLTSAATTKEEADFHRHAAFVLNTFPHLSAEPEDVPALRQAILSLAVQGRLVPTAKRAAPRLNSAEELPPDWRWVKLAEVADCRLGKMLDKQKNRGAERPYLRNTNVHWFRIDLASIKEMRLEDGELETYALEPGDVLICEGGHGIGRTAVWKGEVPGMVFQKALHRVRPSKQLNSHFISYCMKVYSDSGMLAVYFTGAGIPHFTGQSLARLRFPLPPLAEQQRIVAKVEELLRWCDQLDAHLATARTTASHLLDASLRAVLRMPA